jgi:hypothetical protein
MAIPIRQLLSQTSYNADGATTVWNFSFAGGYLDQAHVKAYYTDAALVRTEVAMSPSMFVGPFQLSVVPAVPAATVLTIYRDTPKDLPLVNFADRAALTEEALDLNAKQAIFVAAEATDAVQAEVSSSYAEAAALSAAASLGYLTQLLSTPHGASVNPPANASSIGAVGAYAVDTEYLYIYTGNGVTHSWLRVGVANW